MNFSLVVSIFILTITLAYLGDTLSFVSRLYGAVVDRYAIFTHVGMVVLLANRVAVAFCMPLLGYFVDSQIGISNLIWIYELSLVVLALTMCLIATRIDLAFKALLFFGRAFHKDEMLPNVKEIAPGKLKIDGPALYTMIFYLSGFLLPALVAMMFPDYRATLMQLGFVFNSMGTLINVAVVERRFSTLAQHGKQEEVIEFGRKLLLSRAAATVVVLIGFAALSILVGSS
jgi:hypothetical protein